MSKKGQVTVVIVVGILALAVTAIIFFLVNSSTTESLKVQQENALPADSSSVQLFVEQCLKKTTEDAIHYNFLNGGFYRPTFITFYENWQVPYYFYLGEDVHPLNEEVELGLASYVENHLNTCLNDFSSFQGQEIIKGDHSVVVQIRSGDVLAQLQMPLEIRSGEQTRRLESFTRSLDIPLNYVTGIIAEKISFQQQEPNEVVLTHIVDDAVENNYTFQTLFNNDEVLHILHFNNIIVRNEPLQVQYAAKYDWFGTLSKEVDLKPLARREVRIGETLRIQLNVTGRNLTYSVDEANSELFSVNARGLLTFTPEGRDIGEHKVIVSVQNQMDKDEELLFVEVIE